MDNVTIIEKEGYYIGKVTRGDYFLFYIENPPSNVSEYLDWYRSEIVTGQSLSGKYLPQKLRLWSLEDLEPLANWEMFAEDDEVKSLINDTLLHNTRTAIEIWQDVNAKSSSDYIYELVRYFRNKVKQNEIEDFVEDEEIVVIVRGDSSVGEPDEHIIVTMDYDIDLKDAIREGLEDCFGKLYNTYDVEVEFESDPPWQT